MSQPTRKMPRRDSNIPAYRFGEEAAPNARVWKVYRDAVNELDDDMLHGWTDTLNILLTFVSSSH